MPSLISDINNITPPRSQCPINPYFCEMRFFYLLDFRDRICIPMGMFYNNYCLRTMQEVVVVVVVVAVVVVVVDV